RGRPHDLHARHQDAGAKDRLAGRAQGAGGISGESDEEIDRYAFVPEATRTATGISNPFGPAYICAASLTAARIVSRVASVCARIRLDARAKLPIASSQRPLASRRRCVNVTASTRTCLNPAARRNSAKRTRSEN